MKRINRTAAYFSYYFGFTYYFGKAHFCLAGTGNN